MIVLYLQTFDEVQKTDFAKRMKESTDEIGKTMGKATENISKQTQQFGQSPTFRSISEAGLLQTYISIYVYL